MGYTMNLGPELEFFYFQNSLGTDVLDRGGYFDLTTLDAGSDLRRDTINALHALGIQVEYSHHEVAPSQHEIDLRYKDAMTMADQVMTYRLTVKEIAQAQGRVRHLHAQAHVRGERLGDARAPVALQGRIATPSSTPTTSTTCRKSASRTWPACSPTSRRSPW